MVVRLLTAGLLCHGGDARHQREKLGPLVPRGAGDPCILDDERVGNRPAAPLSELAAAGESV